MLISIQSWCVIKLQLKNIAIQCSLVHKDVSIGIYNIPLLRIFLKMLTECRPTTFLEFHTFKLFLITRDQGSRQKLFQLN